MATAEKQRAAKPPNVVPVVSFDLGNRKVAITDGTQIIAFPSYCMARFARQDIDYSHADYLEHRSFGVDIGARRFIVGKGAGDLGAQPTFGGDKWGLAEQFLFAALSTLGLPQGTHIQALRCSVPDDQSPTQRAPFERLAGREHTFQVNGQEHTLFIERVQIVAEGKMAWYRAIKEGLLPYPHMPNGILDLGGGTAIARIISPNGTIDRAHEKVLQGGTSQLAAMIAAEMGLNNIEGFILDAIANGSFSVHAHNFKPIYDGLLPQWVNGIKGEMRKSWNAINDRYGHILVVGGSANIFRPFVEDNPRYIVAPNPQFYALEAMQNG